MSSRLQAALDQLDREYRERKALQVEDERAREDRCARCGRELLPESVRRVQYLGAVRIVGPTCALVIERKNPTR